MANASSAVSAVSDLLVATGRTGRIVRLAANDRVATDRNGRVPTDRRGIGSTATIAHLAAAAESVPTVPTVPTAVTVPTGRPAAVGVQGARPAVPPGLDRVVALVVRSDRAVTPRGRRDRVVN